MDGSAMETVGALIRWSHLLGATLLVGVFAFLVLVARPAARTADPRAQDLLAPLDRHLRALGAWALLLTLATGLLDLWRQTAVATGLGFGGSLSVESLRAVLFETRYGAVWLVRHAVMLLVAMVAGLADQESDATDWWALRLELAGLGALSLAVTGAAGHAASAQQIPVAAISVDADTSWRPACGSGASSPSSSASAGRAQCPTQPGAVWPRPWSRGSRPWGSPAS
jgi:putative copper export protein